MTVSNWSDRVPPILNSRHFSLGVISSALFLLNGCAILVFYLLADGVYFLSNKLVLYALMHSALGFVLIVLMSIKPWQWRLEQIGVVNLTTFLCIFNFTLCCYMSIATYSSAALYVKIFLWLFMLLYLGCFAWVSVIKPYQKIWSNQKLRDAVLVEKDDHFVFYQLIEASMRNKIGFQQNASVFVILSVLFVSCLSYLFRSYLSAYFGVNWIFIAHAIASLPLATLAVNLMAVSFQYLFVSRYILKKTGKPVYLNSISKNY